MAVWRRKAAAAFPELWRDEFHRGTPILFFFELLPFTQDAHRRNDTEATKRAYEFASWCLHQDGLLWNAAAVAFYEHLFDDWDIHEDVLATIDPDDAERVMPLWEVRVTDEQLAVIRRALLRRR